MSTTLVDEDENLGFMLTRLYNPRLGGTCYQLSGKPGWFQLQKDELENLRKILNTLHERSEI